MKQARPSVGHFVNLCQYLTSRALPQHCAQINFSLGQIGCKATSFLNWDNCFPIFNKQFLQNLKNCICHLKINFSQNGNVFLLEWWQISSDLSRDNKTKFHQLMFFVWCCIANENCIYWGKSDINATVMWRSPEKGITTEDIVRNWTWSKYIITFFPLAPKNSTSLRKVNSYDSRNTHFV